MSKHTDIIIMGADLDGLATESFRELNGLDDIDPNAVYHVSWPDHVVGPQCDGDASAGEVSVSDAIAYVREGAEIYGEVGGLVSPGYPRELEQALADRAEPAEG